MKRSAVLTIALCLLFVTGPVVGKDPGVRPEFRLEDERGVTRIWIEVEDSSGRLHRTLLRETDATVDTGVTGSDPRGRAAFSTWDEDGSRWFAYSRDAGATWTAGRRLQTGLRLRERTVAPGGPMPPAPQGLELPGTGRLFLVQFRTIGLPEWRDTLRELGAEVLSHVPHNAHVVRVPAGDIPRFRGLEFVERIEPYHPSYRIEPLLLGGMRDSGFTGAQPVRVRITTFEWGADGKRRILAAAEAMGARAAEYWDSGHVLELWATHAQIRALAAHDDVLWIDRWLPPESDMDLVRQDAGTDWLEDRFGYCGQGVRGEVMDGGIQDDHPDFDGVMLHGPYGLDSHGTSTYGIVFGNGDRDGDGEGKGTGHMPCEQHQGIFADYGEVTDRFLHTQELKSAPYHATFQTNSWGSSTGTTYNSYSSEMDDIIWRLDIAITQSQSNTGNRSSRPQAWAKNVISVGGIRHYETLDTSDDAWAGGASIGPAADDRIKPDVSYWYDSIYTTTTGGYTSGFGGTSAATPETAGVLGLIAEMWADNVWETDPVGATVFEKQPHASTLKALLINTARQYDFSGTGHDLTRVHQGWGRPGARTAYERAFRSLVVDEEVLLTLAEKVTYDVAVEAGESALKVTMVYPDPPGTTSSTLHRINDVNLKVTSPSATVYHGNVGLDEGTRSVAEGSPNGIDTVENVFVRNPEAGIWQVEIEAAEINQDAWTDTPEDDVTFALVVTGGTGIYGSGEGKVRFLEPAGACGHTYTIRVRDGNVGTSSVAVEVRSDTETVPETLILQETASGSGNYTGTIPTGGGPAVPGDGIVSASHGDTLTVEYVDADDGGGGTNVSRQALAAVDCAGPVISGVGENGITESAANIVWTTDEGSDSSVNWDSFTPPTRTDARAGRGTSHTVRLTGLTECTTYYYSVASEDPVGNRSEDDNAGNWYHFVTLRRTAGELHSCREGKLEVEADAVSCSGTVPVHLTDQDLNQDPGVAETAVVWVTSSTETVPEMLVLDEDGTDSSDFSGSIPTGPGPAVPGDGIVQTSHGDLVTARYEDADGGDGNPVTDFDTVTADCEGAGYLSVSVSDIGENSATVSWTTLESTTGYVDWGTTPALGEQVSSDLLKTSHSVILTPFAACDRIHFRVNATDAHGNSFVADAGGDPFEFNAGTVPGILFRDDFDTGAGWTLQGEWEVAEPLGLGNPPGDPLSAVTGTRILGHDLSGLGAHPGDYEPVTSENAVSPSMDASGLSNAQLLFQRRLNVANGSRGYLDVKDGSGTWINLYSTPTIGGFTESSWSSMTYNISEYADGNPDFQVRFREVSHTAVSYDAGWNVDRFIVRDGSLPSVGACGGCGGGPTFNGIVSVTDDDPCAGSGVTLSWRAAPAWGTGAAGTYAVYRDTAPGFEPGAGNLLIAGITGTAWTDTAVPDDVTLYYLVLAENDETCGPGPNNGGLTDGNRVHLSTADATSQPAPGDVGNTLRVDPVNRAHALLTWAGTPGAATYRIYRSASPDTGFVLHAENPEAGFEDRDVFGDEGALFYLVRTADACGYEGP